jgi:mannitol/fructose-specific phosphotransferase system IIA component (Ntr-type)
MHPVVNHLIQLQELALIRAEQKMSGGAHLEQLDESIANMTSKLPADMRTQYDKLRKKDPIIIVPIADGFCAACRMKIPISLVQAVRMAEQVLSCPNCARMLYWPPTAALRTSKTRRRTAPRKVGIQRFSSSALMIPRLVSDDKEEIIRELATKMEQEGFVNDADMLMELSLRREAILGTGFEHGLAFPHARGVEGGGLALAMGIHKKGVRWDGPGRQLTRIIFFVAIPTAASAFYLKLLAGLAETFTKADNRKAILAEKDPEKLWKLLGKITRATVK